MLSDKPPRDAYGESNRRWISNDYFDLIVWYNPDAGIHGFQLCYGKPTRERALTWIEDRGFSHAEVDSGEQRPTKNNTPILVPSGSFAGAEIRREFQRRAVGLPNS
jgi:hypothetical protein